MKFMLDDIGNYDLLDPMIPFRKRLEQIVKLVERNDWPQNDVQFGRLLEWVDLYRNIVED